MSVKKSSSNKNFCQKISGNKNFCTKKVVAIIFVARARAIQPPLSCFAAALIKSSFTHRPFYPNPIFYPNQPNIGQFGPSTDFANNSSFIFPFCNHLGSYFDQFNKQHIDCSNYIFQSYLKASMSQF